MGRVERTVPILLAELRAAVPTVRAERRLDLANMLMWSWPSADDDGDCGGERQWSGLQAGYGELESVVAVRTNLVASRFG